MDRRGRSVYIANGDRSYSKERLEIFRWRAQVAVLDDFRCLELVRNGSKKVTRTWLRQDKGHRAEWEAFSLRHSKRRRITDTIFRDRGDHARYVARGAIAILRPAYLYWF